MLFFFFFSPIFAWRIFFASNLRCGDIRIGPHNFKGLSEE